MTYRVELQPSGHIFDVEDGESILNASLAAGYQLSYSCRRGTCATCRFRIVSGKVDYGEYVEAMLPPKMKAEGYALLCQATALSDLTVEAKELKLEAQKPKVVPCRVKQIERVTSDIAVIQLRLPQNEEFKYVAGQYIDILLKDGVRRSYSIASMPSAHGVIDLELHIRHLSGGAFTDHVFSDMKPRELLRFEGPLGTTFLREDSDKPIVFLASGTGFAPIKAIIEYALSAGIKRAMTLYWGGRRPGDIYMRGLVEGWAKEHSQFKFVPVISDATAEDNWAGRKGFVHRAVMQDIPDLSGYQVYACGNPKMVDAARDEFMRLSGLREEEFFADPFVTEWELTHESAQWHASSSPNVPIKRKRPVIEIRDPIFKPNNQNSVVKPILMSHGTLECRDLKETRKFFEEFLGLECVRHNRDGMHARCGMKFSIVCLEVETPVNKLSILNHWGLDVESKEAVDAAYNAAIEMKDKYKIRSITDPIMRHGIYSFYLEDLDGNFWEIEYYDGGSVHEDAFDFGDRFEDD